MTPPNKVRLGYAIYNKSAKVAMWTRTGHCTAKLYTSSGSAKGALTQQGFSDAVRKNFEVVEVFAEVSA